MLSIDECRPECFNSCVDSQIRDIEAGYRRGDFGDERRSELTSNAFFGLLRTHFTPKESLRPPAPATSRRRGSKPLHYRIERVLGADTFLVKRGRKEFELRLCSVRVPDRHDEVAAAWCELLLFQRVKIKACCRDADGALRGVIQKIDQDPALLTETINDTMIACGFGHEEEGCRRCAPPIHIPNAIARRFRGKFLQQLHDRAEKRASFLLEGGTDEVEQTGRRREDR